jgi:hypothetical protein
MQTEAKCSVPLEAKVRPVGKPPLSYLMLPSMLGWNRKDELAERCWPLSFSVILSCNGSNLPCREPAIGEKG